MSVHSVFEDQASPSLFEGINARYYRSAEIARSFVPNEQFENLAVRQHSLIIGPRGSGKTTLLRMLHPEALAMWRHPEAHRIRNEVTFSGVYIATDRVWRDQLEAATKGATDEVRNLFFRTVVGIDVMLAVVRTLQVRTSPASAGHADYMKVQLTADAVARLVSELAAGWIVKPQFDDLASLRVALRRRRIEARRWVQMESSAPGAGAQPAWLAEAWFEKHKARPQVPSELVHRFVTPVATGRRSGAR